MIQKKKKRNKRRDCFIFYLFSLEYNRVKCRLTPFFLMIPMVKDFISFLFGMSLCLCLVLSFLFFLFFFFFFWCFRAAPMAFGSLQARGQIRATVAGLHRCHSNARSEPCLKPRPKLTATPGP